MFVVILFITLSTVSEIKSFISSLFIRLIIFSLVSLRSAVKCSRCWWMIAISLALDSDTTDTVLLGPLDSGSLPPFLGDCYWPITWLVFFLLSLFPFFSDALQHQLLVCDMMIDMPPQIKRKFTPRPKVWKLRDPQTCSRFQEVFKAHVPAVETEAPTTTEEIWAKLKTGLLKTTEEVCGTTKPRRWRRETWWWNKEVDDAITAKRQAFKAWKAGKCTRAS